MNLNSVTVSGYLTRDAELRYFPSGAAVAKTTIAVNRSYLKDGEKVEQTDWIPVSVYGERAVALAEHLTKGKLVGVTGSIRTYSTGDGDERRNGFEITVDKFEFGPRRDGNGNGENRGSSKPVNAPRAPRNTPSVSEEDGEMPPW